MTQSIDDEVVNLYEPTADSYSLMMDSEIKSHVYTKTLTRLHQKLGQIAGPLLDISCGSGHMLSLYAEMFKDERDLVGVDLTPRMVELAKIRLEQRLSLD